MTACAYKEIDWLSFPAQLLPRNQFASFGTGSGRTTNEAGLFVPTGMPFSEITMHFHRNKNEVPVNVEINDGRSV